MLSKKRETMHPVIGIHYAWFDILIWNHV